MIPFFPGCSIIRLPLDCEQARCSALPSTMASKKLAALLEDDSGVAPFFPAWDARCSTLGGADVEPSEPDLDPSRQSISCVYVPLVVVVVAGFDARCLCDLPPVAWPLGGPNPITVPERRSKRIALDTGSLYGRPSSVTRAPGCG